MTMDEFERAKDKIMMGAERRSMVMSEDEKRMTAYHEAGHAIVGLTRARARSGVQGHHHSARPRAGRHAVPAGAGPLQPLEAPLESRIATLFGGRVAEELIFGAETVTTGASNDIERATDLARNMVTKWGLSDKLGPLTYSEETGEVFLGRSVTQHKQVSDGTAHAIDEEVRSVIDDNYRSAPRRFSRVAPRYAASDGRGADQVRDDRRDSSSRTSWREHAEAAQATGTTRRRCRPVSRRTSLLLPSVLPPASTNRLGARELGLVLGTPTRTETSSAA